MYAPSAMKSDNNYYSNIPSCECNVAVQCYSFLNNLFSNVQRNCCDLSTRCTLDEAEHCNAVLTAMQCTYQGQLRYKVLPQNGGLKIFY